MSLDKKVEEAKERILQHDRKIIEQTVNETVLKMKMAGLLKENRKTVTEKLEELLRNYKTFKKIQGKEKTAELVKRMDEALESIIDDPYYSVIEYFYFEGYTRERIADIYNTTVTTISRNKTRLLKKLAPQLFSDEVIFEIFLN
jgi:RNA polymerase sigma factor (sigma-70 family)